MIEIDGLWKRFDGVPVVADVQLVIPEREATVIAGPSGSGKTTLLRMIAGLETPDSGEIRIGGESASREGRVILPPDRRRLGMVFQDLALWPHMTVMENLEYGLKGRGAAKAERREKIEALCRWMGLDGKLKRYPASLSGGEKQRVALARAVLPAPDILLMDEPLTSLDPLRKDELLEMIVGLVGERNITLVYVTHDRDEILRLNGNTVVMSEGRVVRRGSCRELMEHPGGELVVKLLRGIAG